MAISLPHTVSLLLCLTLFELHVKGSISNPTDENLIFSTPEIITTIEIPGVGDVDLEAFKIKENDQILQEMPTNPNKSASLRFMSIGHPQIKLPRADQTGSKKCAIPYFFLTPKGFHFNVRTLTNEQRQALASAASRKYQTSIDWHQIVMLTPNTFACTVEITTENETHLIRGEVATFRTNPLKVSFKVPQKNVVKTLLQSLTLTPNMVEISCDVVKRAHAALNDQLIITSNQLESLNLKSKLLGPADKAFVTRNQLSELTREIRQSLNIMELYESQNGGFEPNFINDFLENFGGKEAFRPQPIHEVLAHLSPYNITRDLGPNEIVRELSHVLKIGNSGRKEHIIANQDSSLVQKESSSNSAGTSLSGGAGGFSVSLAANFANSKAKDWARSSKSIDDQLRELNSQSTSDIKFERQGQTIVPKSVDVIQVSKAQLSRQIVFNRIRRKLTQADFRREFHLDLTTATNTDAEQSLYAINTQNFQSQVQEIKQLTTIMEQNLKQHIDEATESLSTTSKRVQETFHQISTINQRMTEFTDKIAFIHRRIDAAEDRTATTSHRINEISGNVEGLQKISKFIKRFCNKWFSPC